jgi:CRP/FNR family transcriptional regulator, anaerobic regulatory protein
MELTTMDRHDNRSGLFLHSQDAVEDVASGRRLLRRAFLEAPERNARREEIILSPEMREPPVLLVRRGIAYTPAMLLNGRRAILDIFLTGDIVGVEHAVAARPRFELKAVDFVTYSFLKPAKLRKLMTNWQIALSALALAAKQGRRRERHIVALTRLDARARMAAFLLGIYDRLREHELITRPNFAFPFTQGQIADHLGLTVVHVSRTLRRLRDEGLALVDRQVSIITNLAGLRRVANGGEEPVHETASGELQARAATALLPP